MKIKRNNVKLSFNKETVVNLELVQMDEARGGTGHETSPPCVHTEKPTQSCPQLGCSQVC